mgnify:FL=1
MEIIKMNDIKGSKNKKGVKSKVILEHNNARLTNLQLNEGDVVPEHSVPVNVFFYIVKGKGTLQIGDEKKVVNENEIIPCPPETTMSLKADQGEEFYVLNVKTPNI